MENSRFEQKILKVVRSIQDAHMQQIVDKAERPELREVKPGHKVACHRYDND